MPATLTNEDVERIADAVALKLGTQTPKLAVGVGEVAAMLGTGSRSATYRMIDALGLKSFSGLYRVKDIENALARRTR